MKGLLCRIFKWNGETCSNGGISSKTNKVVLLGPDAPFEPDVTTPAVTILKQHNGSYHYAVPADPDGTPLKGHGVGPMFGGTFIYSSDARFPSLYPIPLHDRWESQEQYNANFD